MTEKVNKEEIDDTVERKVIGNLATAETDGMDDIEEIEVKKKEKEKKRLLKKQNQLVKRWRAVGSSNP